MALTILCRWFTFLPPSERHAAPSTTRACSTGVAGEASSLHVGISFKRAADHSSKSPTTSLPLRQAAGANKNDDAVVRIEQVSGCFLLICQGSSLLTCDARDFTRHQNCQVRLIWLPKGYGAGNASRN